MIYAYYRKISEQNTEKFTRQIYQWAEKHNKQIDEFIWEDFLTQKISFEKRNLSVKLLPKLKNGDLLIVSQLSCLGRSAAELDMLFNKILKEKQIRVVCIPIDLDIDFRNLSPSNESTLEKIAYAAKLQSFLAHEVTASALLSKKAEGVKTGGASNKWKESYQKKSKEQLREEYYRKGRSKNQRYLESKDVVTFLKILQEVFKEACNGEPYDWDWSKINTKGENRNKLLGLMHDYKELDESGTLFAKWDFSDLMSEKLRVRLCANIQNVRKSIFYQTKRTLTNNNIEQGKNNLPTKKQSEFFVNESKLNQIEEDTRESQRLLADIFDDLHNTNEDENIQNTHFSTIKGIMTTLLSKETWLYDEVESLCKQHGLLTDFVLEQINEYSYSKVEDAVVSEDGNEIFVITDYKKQLI